MNWAWKFRGFWISWWGGIGLRRGRTHPTRLKIGDALDFWRVLLADEKNRRLLLYAEMKLPGEAWLEFEIIPNETGGDLKQTATFAQMGYGAGFIGIVFTHFMLLFLTNWQSISQRDKNFKKNFLFRRDL